MISSFQIWVDVGVILKGIQEVFVDSIGASFVEKQAAYAGKFSTLVSVQEALGPIEIALGDFIVLWRVWALCAGQKRLVFVPFIFLLGTTICSLGFFGCFAHSGWPVVTPPTCSNLITSAYSLSIVTNISGTVVIGFKFWSYRRNVRIYLSKSKKSRAEKVLVLFLESGTIYSLLWIVLLVVACIPPPPTLAGQIVQQIFRAATAQLVGIYPTLLIVLVYLQRSLWDSSGNSTFVTLEGGSSAKDTNLNEINTSQTSLYNNQA
ncbi:hypothetical protein PM082_023924 [Marasmius tenuissimus]|nr:hypothetical protein PM082_023924 [Marasmius tenuissimus]